MKKILINNLLIALIFFFLLEIFLKTFNLSDLRGHGPELVTKQKSVETIVFGKKVYLNSFGYRSPNIEYKYSNKKRKIIFIGDSVLFGSGVDVGNIFVSKLEKNNNNISYINAGIIGNDLTEHLGDIKKNNELFPNSEFVIVLTLDDIENSIDQTPDKNTKINDNFFNSLKRNILVNRINNFLRTKSYSYLWLKGITTKPSERYFKSTSQHYNKKSSLNYFSERVEEIQNFQEINIVKIKFLILPYEYQTRNNCNNTLLFPQEKIKKIFIEKKVNFLDLTETFCNYNKPNKLYLNFDPVHLSIEGHDMVYEYLSKKLI